MGNFVTQGAVDYLVSVNDDDVTDGMSDDQYNLRIYPEADFIFGAATNFNGGGLGYYFKGFQYTLRFGVEFFMNYDEDDMTAGPTSGAAATRSALATPGIARLLMDAL